MNIAELDELDEATRLEIEGFQTGTYLRLEFHDVPSEMAEHFDACHPVLVGGIGLGEENVGFMQVGDHLQILLYFNAHFNINSMEISLIWCFQKMLKGYIFLTVETKATMLVHLQYGFDD